MFCERPVSIFKWLPLMVLHLMIACVLFLTGYFLRGWNLSYIITMIELSPAILFLILFEWSLLKTVTAEIPLIRQMFQLPQVADYAEDLNESIEILREEPIDIDRIMRMVDTLPIHTRAPHHFPNFCYVCRIIQPDRTVHCERCETCVPRHDHHCNLLNCCIHFGNTKFFILSQLYLFISTFIQLIIILILMSYTGRNAFLEKNRINIAILLIFLAVAFIVLLITLRFYTFLLLINQTLYENRRGIYLKDNTRNDLAFDLGWKRNIEEIFGKNKFLWFIPVFTTNGTGDAFEILSKAEYEDINLE